MPISRICQQQKRSGGQILGELAKGLKNNTDILLKHNKKNQQTQVETNRQRCPCFVPEYNQALCNNY